MHMAKEVAMRRTSNTILHGPLLKFHGLIQWFPAAKILLQNRFDQGTPFNERDTEDSTVGKPGAPIGNQFCIGRLI